MPYVQLFVRNALQAQVQVEKQSNASGEPSVCECEDAFFQRFHLPSAGRPEEQWGRKLRNKLQTPFVALIPCRSELPPLCRCWIQMTCLITFKGHIIKNDTCLLYMESTLYRSRDFSLIWMHKADNSFFGVSFIPLEACRCSTLSYRTAGVCFLLFCHRCLIQSGPYYCIKYVGLSMHLNLAEI